MSKRKKKPLKKNVNGLIFGGEVTNTILPSLLLKFEYMSQKKSYVKGGFCGLSGGGTQSLLKNNHI
jgi:Ni,Fe-hydrogenase III small subunit